MALPHACLATLIVATLCPVPRTASAAESAAAGPGPIIGAPRPQQWADLARLPDWSGIWTPDKGDQLKQASANQPPWNAKAAARVRALLAEEQAGHPRGFFTNCLPYGMPALMVVTHNAMEFLFSPGRVTILGEGDGNRLRRIYTDGRAHPPDPDQSFGGDSIGHWEGDTLVVDTVAMYPQTLIPISEAVAIPNNGDMHVVERIHVVSKDEMHDDLAITAPHVLTKPWLTTRIFYRQRARRFEIQEGACLQGRFREEVDENGDAIWAPIQFTPEGAPLP